MEASGLNEKQRTAVLAAVSSGITILTGGPGTGKTTATKEIVKAAHALGLSVSIIAPTGRAAMRSTEVTGAPAATIHKAIGGPPGSRRDLPLQEDLIVLEECSMVGTETMAWLLENLSPSTRLVLVGDPDQLPSIEHGAVLRDLLRSEAVPATHLTSVYRQGEESGIIVAAKKVRTGEGIDGTEGSGFFFVDVDSRPRGTSADAFALQRLASAVGWLTERGDLPSLQVLTPVKGGALGTEALNEMLQEQLNPGGTPGPVIGGGTTVREGDRVIQVRNDYTLGEAGIMNGQQGLVAEVDPHRIRVAFDDDDLWIDGFRLYNLHLAWAVTIHKSQGSEWPNVVVVADRSHGALLSRQLLYTALTRAKQAVVLISSQDALQLAATNNASVVRITGLARHLGAHHG